jgi:hypothetical protein
MPGGALMQSGGWNGCNWEAGLLFWSWPGWALLRDRLVGGNAVALVEGWTGGEAGWGASLTRYELLVTSSTITGSF